MRRLWLAVAIAALATCRAPRPPAFSGGVEVPLAQSRRGTLFVPVVVNGHPLRFVLDTGATITAVNPSVAQSLGLVATGSTLVNRTIRAELTSLDTLAIGSLRHTHVRAAVIELPEARRIDEPFDGVLGLDILGQHDVAIDMPRQRVVFYPAGALAHDEDVTDKMLRVDFKKSRLGLIALTVDLEERGRLPAYLDLGAQRTFTNPITANWIQGSGVERQPRAMKLGPVRWERVLVIVEDLPIFSQWIGTDELAVVLGADLFRDRALVVSYQESALFVAR